MAINLQKGQRIDLRKGGAAGAAGAGSALVSFCVGANWGAIETKSGIFGLGKKITDVDLDLSCVLIDANNQPCDHIYSPLYRPELLQQFGLPPGKVQTSDNAMRHSGDDLTGDKGGDDGLDNEIITVDLSRINPNVTQIFFFLNNAGQEDFSQIPFATIRMYEGTPTMVKEVFATFNVAADPQYKGRKAMILGKLYKKGDEWKFNAIGDPTEDVFLGQTIHRIVKSYL
jgi:tellurium resistance protein TerZ